MPHPPSRTRGAFTATWVLLRDRHRPAKIIGIDAGINGQIDHEQGEWLRWISSSSPKPKSLLTGKPIYVDNQYHYDEGGIEDGATKVDDIVRMHEHNYVAAIGGDIHNYQRYPVKVGNRTIGITSASWTGSV